MKTECLNEDMNDSKKYISQLLRTDIDTILQMDEQITERFSKQSTLDSIVRENQVRTDTLLKSLAVKERSASEIYNALIDKVEADDRALKNALSISSDGVAGYQILAQKASELACVGEGFFLKWERARELIHKNPPKNIMSFFNYRTPKELLDKEDIKKVFASLRFAEDKEWLNKTFFASYRELSAADFEMRPIEMLVLENKWLQLAEHFLKKKYHNVSHLKELGVIFVLPQNIATPGEALRLFTLLLHYLHEVTFYSELFKGAADPTQDVDFIDFFVSALRGDIIDKRLPDSKQRNWMIVQRYLAKDDENDWRLFEPHINPEALHWQRAEENIAHIHEKFSGLDLSFWHNLGWIGDFFPTATGTPILVSFNLVDTVMSLVMKKELIKYLYHHQEALWNKIFASYAGKDALRSLVIKNFSKGYISL